MREFEGKDLPEALAAAAAALGVPEASLRYELVEEGRRGILGLGARPTRIRVTVDGAIAADPVRPAPRRSSDMDRASLEAEVSNVQEADEEAGAGGADLADIRETVLTLFRLAGFALEADVRPAGSAVRVVLTGKDRQLLVQRDGELLSSLEVVLQRMARRRWPEAGPIHVECEGWRRRGDEDLIEMVREIASQVLRTGRAKQLRDLNPYERRLVHLTVRDFPGLTSASSGDGFLKPITIARSPATD